ncbi:ArsR/SmtB family transcription factor [Streptomyces celluloflavus]|uniref:ArsR/SmtB family transcription factor n=1 Tax=Streptomyces celluloflavus TaxID=58344 RepID=UPI00345F60C9|nr:helix-turn-helix domain-containing protein [Streptomyces celluloflavus]
MASRAGVRVVRESAAEGGAERPGCGAQTWPVPAGAPAPLAEPDRADLRLETVMGALSDPLRMRIVRTLLLESEAFDHTCGWFGFDRPKSSLTHHFRTLRDAGLIRQRQYGLERRSHVRADDLEARFPGLLALVADWDG